MAEENQPKWEGKATVELIGTTAEQIWPFWEDFCNAHKWFPDLDTCYQVKEEPGLVRYCSTTNAPSFGGNTISWVKEKLLLMDSNQRCLSYEVTDNNVGIKSYVATIKVLPMNDDGGKKGCMIEWSFVTDPIEGRKLGDMVTYVDHCLQFMAKKMEQDVLSAA